MERKRY